MCEAKNEAGIATTWAELLVESKQRFLECGSHRAAGKAAGKAAWLPASMHCRLAAGPAIMRSLYAVNAAVMVQYRSVAVLFG